MTSRWPPRAVALCVAGALLVPPSRAAFTGSSDPNAPPSTPVITEPAKDGALVNHEDVHMECAPFADPDPGDAHACTDWEIWTVSPPQRVWAALCVQGPERLHVHLGDGAFENSHAGRLSLLPGAAFILRVRHRDSSGDPASEWSDYAQRPFSTGHLAAVFPLALDDIADDPPPTLSDPAGLPLQLPGGPTPASIRLESAQGELLLALAGPLSGGGTQNQVNNPPSLSHHAPIRVRIDAGDQPLAIPDTDLAFSDHDGARYTIYIPQAGLQPGQSIHLWVDASGGTYAAAPGQTEPDFSTLARGPTVPWAVSQPGFRVEVVATGFHLPVNIAFVPNPGSDPADPLFYVTELYGSIKVVRRNGAVGTYAANLINFNPTGRFPGSGEQGVAGLCIDPATGDLFASLLYDAAPPNGPHYPRVVRFHSTDGGQTAATQTTILDMPGETQGQSHQVSNLSIGPDGKLYVHMGDGFTYTTAQDLDSFRGKILRVNLDGSAPADNPFYNAANGINARDYIYAYGLRNPFGGAWRSADASLYEVENGPSIDRFAKVVRGRNYLWDNSNQSMANFALYNWNPAAGPVNLVFIEPSRFGGSGFPPSKMGHAFVTESGPTWSTGPQPFGKRISEFVLDPEGDLLSGPTPLIEYSGPGKATCVGLAAGPDGLYFSDLYKDQNYLTPIDPGASILRVRFVGSADFTADVTSGLAPLTVSFSDISSIPSPASRLWSFGDGDASTEPSPTHTYTREGLYTVRLTVTGPDGVSVLQRPAYIRVGPRPRVALIGGSFPPRPADRAAGDRLAAMNLDVTYFDDNRSERPSAAQLAADFDLVVVSSTSNSNNVAGDFRTAPVPLIFWDEGLLRLDREPLADSGAVVSGQISLTILPTGHRVTQGIPPGPAEVFYPEDSMSVAAGTIAPGAAVLATGAGSDSPCILAAEAGAPLLGGYTPPARRVFLFFADSSFFAATPLAAELFQSAACWALNLDPAITAGPAPLTVSEGHPATFTLTHAQTGPLAYQWRRNGVPLPPAPRILGATTSLLTILSATPDDAGEYDVVVSDPCGTAVSPSATLTVIPACPADWNHDASVDSADISAFLDGWLLALTGGTLAADFNADGTVNSADISAFLAAWLADVQGGC